jgi:hypothetical protein
MNDTATPMPATAPRLVADNTGLVAEVNLRSGVSRLLPGEGGRVVGLVVPNGDAPGAPALPERPAAAPRPGRAP